MKPDQKQFVETDGRPFWTGVPGVSRGLSADLRLCFLDTDGFTAHFKRLINIIQMEIIMETVENGLFVSVEYKGTLGDGEVFDSSEGRQPLEIKMGAGQVIQGFESALMGMALNEKKTFTLEPDAAYGHRSEEFMHTFSRDEVPPEMNPEEGETILLSTPEGQQISAHVVEVNDEIIVVDMNHPLAGEALTFEIEVVGISKTATREPHGGCGCGCDESGCDSGGCSSGCC